MTTANTSGLSVGSALGFGTREVNLDLTTGEIDERSDSTSILSHPVPYALTTVRLAVYVEIQFLEPSDRTTNAVLRAAVWTASAQSPTFTPTSLYVDLTMPPTTTAGSILTGIASRSVHITLQERILIVFSGSYTVDGVSQDFSANFYASASLSHRPDDD
jgi:hypothetical protein